MKKYGKSAAALLLVALVLVSIVPVSAADLRNAPIQVTSFNEFDYIEKIQSYSKEELVNSGVSAEDAERILEFDYKEALFERAQLPANKLEALGYTEDQIQALKDFAANPDGDYDLSVTSATLQGRLSLVSGGSTFRTVKYTWHWSSMPLMALKEYVGMRWQGVDSNGYTVDMTNPPNTSSSSSNRSGTVTYYDVNSGEQSGTYPLNLINGSVDKIVSANFPMSKSVGGSTLWAKSGYITCRVQTNGVPVNYVNFQATYGHQVISGSVSISVGGAFGISFTPTLRVDNFTCNAKIYATYVVAQ